MVRSRLSAVALGTAGGPVWWPGGKPRAGISTAVVVEDAVYLVDAGTGVGRQFTQAGFSLSSLRGIFLSHLHSDHTVDLASLAIFGVMRLPDEPTHTIRILGPGEREVLPVASPRAAKELTPEYAQEPTPGTRRMFDLLMRAHATDINDRLFDSLRPTPRDWFQADDISIPSGTGYHPNDCPTPDMDPFVVYEDERVQVEAILVKHAPMAPAFGYRFTSDYGSVVVSGDTGPTENMIRLSERADLLFHEAVDFDWVDRRYEEQRTASAEATRDHHRAAHTSPRGAIDIANEAGVRSLALHHLAPGNTPHEVWARDGELFSGAFSVPEDLAVFSIR